MRTAKTLLIAAAALAATVTASKAQTVYSQNVVGYVNITVTNSTLALVANQLDTGSNTMDNVFQSGIASQKTLILEWTGSGYNQYEYYNTADANAGFLSAGAGWYNFVTGNADGQTNLVQPGYGFFIHNEQTGAGSITMPTVGQVIQGTNVYVFPANSLAIYSLPEPLAGQALDSTNVNFPAISQKTLYLTWTGSGYNQYEYYNTADANAGFLSAGAGWYNFVTGNFADTTPSVWPSAGQSFFIHNESSSTAIKWTNTFEVQ